MPVLELAPPSERQKEFLLADRKFVAFGGARGGGKSWAVRTKAILLCMRYPGIKVMIVRKTYTELQENHIMPMTSLLGCYAPSKAGRIASYNDSKKNITFPNGSRILFRYCDNDKDAERYQGTEADILFIDEATQQSEERFKKLTACIRGTNGFPKRIYLTCNPGGVGHAWVKRLFIDRKFVGSENPDDYMFIRSLVTDNKVLMQTDPDYIKLLGSMPPKLKKAWLDGDWNIFEGQFFEDFVDNPEHYADRRFTHVIAPFDISDGWNIVRSFDWGYARPFSCAWWAIDYDGIIYRILELYGFDGNANTGVKWAPDKVFAEIHRIETEHRWLRGKNISGVADPAIWDAESGESINDVAARHGVYFDKGDHSRIPGWMQMHYRMQFDADGYPKLYVFSNCKAFIRTIPTLVYDKNRPEDLDSDGEDHCADEARYFCMSRPIQPRIKSGRDSYFDSPMYVAFGISKKDILPPPSARSGFEIIDNDRQEDKRQ